MDFNTFLFYYLYLWLRCLQYHFVGINAAQHKNILFDDVREIWCGRKCAAGDKRPNFVCDLNILMREAAIQR
jgi:hypothetical protein